jgi:hypothetical protein
LAAMRCGVGAVAIPRIQGSLPSASRRHHSICCRVGNGPRHLRHSWLHEPPLFGLAIFAVPSFGHGIRWVEQQHRRASSVPAPPWGWDSGPSW